MVRGSNPVKVQEWAERLARRRKSDRSVAQFCDDEGVSVASFYQWQRKLRDVVAANDKKSSTASPADAATTRRTQVSAAGIAKRRAGFQALQVTSAGPLGASAAVVTVCLPGGIQVQVADNLPAIQTVMRELLSGDVVESGGLPC